MGIRHREEFAALFGAEDPRHHVLGVYASGLLMLRHFVNDLRKGRAPRYSKIKRLCLQLIDLEPRYHNLLIVLIHLDGHKGNLFVTYQYGNTCDFFWPPGRLESRPTARSWNGCILP